MNDWNSLKRWFVPMAGVSLTAASLLWAQDTGRTPRSGSRAVRSAAAPTANPPAAIGPATTTPAKAAPAKAGSEAPAGVDAAVAEIRATAQAYLKAIHAADYRAAAGFWNPAGDYIDSEGVTHNVQALFAKRVAELDASANAIVEQPRATEEKPREAGDIARAASEPVPTIGVIRLITPDVAIEDGSWHLSHVAERRAHMRFTAVWTRAQGKWRLDSLRESIGANESPAERLKALAWLVGEWEASVGSMTLRMRCESTDEGNFLTRELEAGRNPDRLKLLGSQRIGWDSSRHQLKSWFFEADGGSGEGYWTHAGDVWTTRATVTHPNGAVATAATRYTLIDPDHIRLESTDIQADGEKKRDITLDFHRKRS